MYRVNAWKKYDSRREKEVIWIDKDTFSSDEEIADHIVDLWRNKHAGE